MIMAGLREAGHADGALEGSNAPIEIIEALRVSLHTEGKSMQLIEYRAHRFNHTASKVHVSTPRLPRRTRCNSLAQS